MNCKDVQERLSDYIDGVLKGEVSDELRGHLEKCGSCREEYETHQATWDFLGTWQDIEPHPSFKARFWEEVSRSEARISPLSAIIALFTGRAYIWAASTAMIVVIVLLLLFRAPSEELFDEPYFAWQGLPMQRAVSYVEDLDESRYQMVAFAPEDAMLQLPEYVEYGEAAEEAYPDLGFAERGVSLMEGTHEVVIDIISYE